MSRCLAHFSHWILKSFWFCFISLGTAGGEGNIKMCFILLSPAFLHLCLNLISLWYLTLPSVLSGMTVLREVLQEPKCGLSAICVCRWTPFGFSNEAMQMPGMQMKLTANKEERTSKEYV